MCCYRCKRTVCRRADHHLSPALLETSSGSAVLTRTKIQSFLIRTSSLRLHFCFDFCHAKNSESSQAVGRGCYRAINPSPEWSWSRSEIPAPLLTAVVPAFLFLWNWERSLSLTGRCVDEVSFNVCPQTCEHLDYWMENFSQKYSVLLYQFCIFTSIKLLACNILVALV